ncbi:pyruvate dehydrogenase complex dihydrolipoamide acetyltransferase [Ehrlichia ruminantium]|uniref:Acetyltransferase component of pyruvate dehydrogenase complex n=1 Tax=Ehrlichia ruminantium (strain Welgevonden) TaxID=254945 RepID=A0A0H3M509_EHRRW|nr:pyruvate dehydrogenase complex dihydrolipoamide acetyltransferase [Ehrlichia ruminantium]QLK54740.1 pyruvate dehydrogenase complex dihydrolipoamide acetyltransferase [Ehrlichia ruminantium]QLK55659.1 pyruvate dehydrogenase complex dihydrolipoamide acetyltransferase [Ehrlichia ruminantium]UOD98853.1 pyruvate dehydrogenase complex dihydrolipoamide acetyltransferase [Ehrlichia ruminantium]UOD99760.1 pyruvate dehydrogenase complex dihydrolipoamide acetyltransferase [Ehrlichia ruminantium]CAH577
MFIEVLMPALSPTMTSGIIRKWYKSEGEEIKSGDIIADIETDKAVMEFEYTDEDGIMGKIIVAEGTKNVLVNQLIALIVTDKLDLKEVDAYVSSSTASKTEKASVVLQGEEEIKNDVVTISEPKRIKISPLAKKIASDFAIDINSIQGTGPYGRIVKADVLDAASKKENNVEIIPTSNGENTFIEVSSMRKVIAERLVYSKQMIPHFYVSVDCKVDDLLKVRLEINAENFGTKITINDFIIKAVSMSIKKFPEINVSWDDNDKIIAFANVDISVAVSIDDGLITPIIRNADKKSLLEISNEVKMLASKAKTGKLKPEEFQGGGFTISNLGMFGIKEFNAIINPPQSCIMAVGCSDKRAIIVDDQICISNVMTVTLSVDHRVIDGVLAAKFLNCFKSYIEKPYLMLI